MIYQLLLLSACVSYVYGACCIVHDSAASCTDELDNECVWLETWNPIFEEGKSGGYQCIAEKFLECASTGVCPPPSLARSSDCHFPACSSNHYAVNAAIVIDESGSVGLNNYLISLDFVENMLRYDFNDVSKIGMIAFGAVNDHVHDFSDDKESLLKALDAERSDYASGGSTRIGAALESTQDLFERANLPEDDVNIVFLMTDGQPHDEICSKKAYFDEIGVEIYVVGVGSGFNIDRVKCLVNDRSNILDIKKFEPRQFYALESKLRNVVCPTVFMQEKLAVATDVAYQTGYEHGQVMFWAVLITVCLAAVAYFVKTKMCNGDAKMSAPLLEQKVQQYV